MLCISFLNALEAFFKCFRSSYEVHVSDFIQVWEFMKVLLTFKVRAGQVNERSFRTGQGASHLSYFSDTFHLIELAGTPPCFYPFPTSRGSAVGSADTPRWCL